MSKKYKFVNKPSWDDAPEWAEALVLDKADCQWAWFSTTNIIRTDICGEWFFAGSGADDTFERSGHFEPSHKGWKKSMEARPKVTKSVDLSVGDTVKIGAVTLKVIGVE